MSKRFWGMLAGAALTLALFVPVRAAEKDVPASEPAERVAASEPAENGPEAQEQTGNPVSIVQIELKNQKRVYFGRADSVTDESKIKVIEVRKVFPEICHYKNMLAADVPYGSARYWIYMAKANKVFNAGLKKVSTEMMLQMVSERGNIIKIDNKPVDKEFESKMDISPALIKIVRNMS